MNTIQFMTLHLLLSPAFAKAIGYTQEEFKRWCHSDTPHIPINFLKPYLERNELERNEDVY